MSAPTAAVPGRRVDAPRAAPARPPRGERRPGRGLRCCARRPLPRARPEARRVAAAAGKDQRNPTVRRHQRRQRDAFGRAGSWDGVFSRRGSRRLTTPAARDRCRRRWRSRLRRTRPLGARRRASSGSARRRSSTVLQAFAAAPRPHRERSGAARRARPGEEADPILIAHDGFIVGKHQQKHHVRGGEVPQLQPSEVPRDNSTVKCVHIPSRAPPRVGGP